MTRPTHRTIQIRKRRLLLAAAVAPFVGGAIAADSPAPSILVFKSPTCGCCSQWAEHMVRNGFRVETRNLLDLAPIKARHGVPPGLQSCHTAVVGNYVIEGHVPADAVKRLLAQRPRGVVGLAVPGMPPGSPGMESPTPRSYDVIAFDAWGSGKVFERR